jgi:AcrR family transcriptional regulator
MKDDRIARSLDAQGTPVSEGLLRQQRIGRRKRHAAETRSCLIQSALQLIAERGYPDVTVADITEAADVGKGTFYNYFQSKEHILATIAEIQQLTVSHALDEAETGQRTIRFVFNRLASRMCEEVGRSPNLARGFLSSLVTSNAIPQIRPTMLEECRMITEIIKMGQKRGEINSNLDQERLALQFQQSIFGTVLLWSLQGEPNLRDSVAVSVKYFWKAIAAPRK